MTSGDQDQRPIQTCSLEEPPPDADIWWIATEACTVSECEVHILLECFLVTFKFGIDEIQQEEFEMYTLKS